MRRLAYASCILVLASACGAQHHSGRRDLSEIRAVPARSPPAYATRAALGCFERLVGSELPSVDDPADEGDCWTVLYPNHLCPRPTPREALDECPVLDSQLVSRWARSCADSIAPAARTACGACTELGQIAPTFRRQCMYAADVGILTTCGDDAVEAPREGPSLREASRQEAVGACQHDVFNHHVGVTQAVLFDWCGVE